MHQHIVAIPIDQLRPTQMTVGYAEVRLKRLEWSKLAKKARRTVLLQHLIPCVIGPRQRRYVIDHHHLCLALREEDVDTVWTHALEDYSWLEPDTFWKAMEYRRWVHPYDGAGRRREFRDIPKRFEDMRDDPYRSLAALVRVAGGYTKDVAPFAEFAWADFFRSRVKLKRGGRIGAGVVRTAVQQAHTTEARYLPGWSGRWPA
jgi:hypothetical protein